MSAYHRPDTKTLQTLRDIANKLRIDSIEATQASNSGHPTSCCSAAEIMSVLFFHAMKYTLEEPRGPANDRFVLSKVSTTPYLKALMHGCKTPSPKYIQSWLFKPLCHTRAPYQLQGHAAPILYAAWAEAGLFDVSLLKDLRKLDSDLEGHPTPRLSFVDVATGSLGQGLSCAVGMAYTGKYFDKSDYRVYCLVGDGESAEGSIWEAMAFGSKYKLDNMVAIFDVNRLGQSDPTALEHDMETYKKRCEGFGWNTHVVDGHDVESLCKAFHDATTVKGVPTCILAKTFKGKGIEGIEDKMNWHGKPLGEEAKKALAVLKERMVQKEPHGLLPHHPTATVPDVDISNIQLSEPPNYKKDEAVATRLAYATALVKIGKNNKHVVAMDGDTKNSTFSQRFQEAFPDRFIECFIAEQNLVGVGIGCACRDRTVPFISTFAAFLSRAFDQIRMGAISQSNANFVGSHAGISIGEDGPSQMALEDLAMFRSIPGSTVFYPSDAVSCERAVELAANTKGICFIRTSRPNIPMIYSNNEKFAVGKAKVVRQSPSDHVTVIGCCVTLVEALTAAKELEEEGISIRVIDPFTIKPLDAETIIKNAKETGGRIITVEDHYAWGGLGDAVSSAVSECRDIIVKKLAVMEVPRSGKPAELMKKYGISSESIKKAVHQILDM